MPAASMEAIAIPQKRLQQTTHRQRQSRPMTTISTLLSTAQRAASGTSLETGNVMKRA
jgi:hypothetical protein